MQIVNKVAARIARLVEKLTPEQRADAFQWALDKLGGAPVKRRKRRTPRATAPAQPSPAPARATAARKPAARKPARRTSRPEPEEEDEAEDDE